MTGQGAEDRPGVGRRGIGDAALRVLHEYGLITHSRRAEPRAVLMHALTARAARDTLAPGQLATWASCAATALIDLWPEHDYADPALEEVLRANAGRLHGHLGDGLYAAPDGPRLLTRYARSSAAAGLLRDAVDIWAAHAATTERLLGPDAPETVAALCGRAEALVATGDHAAGLALAKEAADRAARTTGPGSEAHLGARLVAVQAHGAAGWYARAAALAGPLVEDALSRLGPGHRLTVSARLAAADAERLCDRPDAAAGYEQAVLERSEVPGALGADDALRVAGAVLTTLLMRTGDAYAAYTAAERLLERREALHGAGGLAAVRHLRTSELERDRLRENAQLTHRLLKEQGIPFLSDLSHIVSVLVGDEQVCKEISELLLERHAVYVQAISAPSVRVGEEILRAAPGAVHGTDEVRGFVEALDRIWEELALPRSPSPSSPTAR
ncbi:aminotransferase class I/II-fold pyridoxal phosphate-dependent enzyme [Kitasatospora camelliae]|uniref:8-amino-7-oxononanoate synthase n=1 Tax=Kitasatospora camelliae TaxID=3156397 RepID=A0AAU8K6N6_9ACTN